MPKHFSLPISTCPLLQPWQPRASTGVLGTAPGATHRRGTCPAPGISAGGSAGSGCGWCGRSGSSSAASRSSWHCSAGCAEKNPARDGNGLGRCPVGRQHPPGPSRAHLAAFAGDNAVVNPRGLVPADLARDHLDLGCGGGKRGGENHGVNDGTTEPRRPPTPATATALWLLGKLRQGRVSRGLDPTTGCPFLDEPAVMLTSWKAPQKGPPRARVLPRGPPSSPTTGDGQKSLFWLS